MLNLEELRVLWEWMQEGVQIYTSSNIIFSSIYNQSCEIFDPEWLDWVKLLV